MFGITKPKTLSALLTVANGPTLPTEPRLTMKVLSSIFNAIQTFLAGLFLAAALIGIVVSFAELPRLAEWDAIKHAAERSITGSR